MEPYNTEDEQVEALRRWWNENGRSTAAAVVLALVAGLGWQAYQANEVQQAERASDAYESLLQIVGAAAGQPLPQAGVDLAESIKGDFSGSSYAQFAALHLASASVSRGNLGEAEAQLRWVLGKAPQNSDMGRIAQLRLARVIAASGDTDQALAIIAGAGAGSYGASYASAKGDILFAAGREDEAKDAYSQALALAAASGSSLPALQQKLQSLISVASAPAINEPAVDVEPTVETLDEQIIEQAIDRAVEQGSADAAEES